MSKKIAIISSERFAGKINEDLLLQDALLRLGEKAEIIPWEAKDIEWQKYKSAVLRSCWGYHKKLNEFIKFLNRLQSFDVQLFNDAQIVKWNIQKDLQFKELNLLGIATIPSHVVSNPAFDLKKIITQYGLEKYKNIVIKPTVSGSGDNTYIICLDKKEGNLKNKLSIEQAQAFFQKAMADKCISGFMLQPFLGGIVDGEFSFIYIDSELTHIAARYPGIFADKKDAVEVDKSCISHEMMLFARQCQKALLHITNKIQKGLTPVYTRCDIVKNNNQLFLMEAEMAEPDLLIRTISSPQKRTNVMGKLAETISRRSR